MSQVADTEDTGSTFGGSPARGAEHDGGAWAKRSPEDIMPGAWRTNTRQKIAPSSTGEKRHRRRKKNTPSSKKRSRRRLYEFLRGGPTGISQPVAGLVEIGQAAPATSEVTPECEDDSWKKRRRRRRNRKHRLRDPMEATDEQTWCGVPDDPDSTKGIPDTPEYGVEELDSTLRTVEEHSSRETKDEEPSQEQPHYGQMSKDEIVTDSMIHDGTERKDMRDDANFGGSPVGIYERAMMIYRDMIDSSQEGDRRVPNPALEMSSVEEVYV